MTSNLLDPRPPSWQHMVDEKRRLEREAKLDFAARQWGRQRQFKLLSAIILLTIAAIILAVAALVA